MSGHDWEKTKSSWWACSRCGAIPTNLNVNGESLVGVNGYSHPHLNQSLTWPSFTCEEYQLHKMLES